ncbi:hypothetical protein B0J11DRAFT_429520 [Dendryphion nanum]|uniref:Uncharacterized protein n=1 Tax=Dendryphion nanum TaxID=256645 RepID=A0A9P9E622_9PLEO|nr:hypothetical protein B0J11DRAFT_429520 [Dendryphion nanum]
MEGTNALNSKLAFLQTAIHKIAVESPTVAATLGAERDLLLQSLDADLNMSAKELRQLRQETCGACGNLMTPGWSSSVIQLKQLTKGKIRRKKLQVKKSSVKEMVHCCLRCNRKTTLPLDYRPPKHTRKPVLRETGSVPSTIGVVVPVMETPEIKNSAPKTASTSSKQRAKARKGGLQAMLAQSKVQASSKPGLGLDLMDFMQ